MMSYRKIEREKPQLNFTYISIILFLTKIPVLKGLIFKMNVTMGKRSNDLKCLLLVTILHSVTFKIL